MSAQEENIPVAPETKKTKTRSSAYNPGVPPATSSVVAAIAATVTAPTENIRPTFSNSMFAGAGSIYATAFGAPVQKADVARYDPYTLGQIELKRLCEKLEDHNPDEEAGSVIGLTVDFFNLMIAVPNEKRAEYFGIFMNLITPGTLPTDKPLDPDTFINMPDVKLDYAEILAQRQIQRPPTFFNGSFNLEESLVSTNHEELNTFFDPQSYGPIEECTEDSGLQAFEQISWNTDYKSLQTGQVLDVGTGQQAFVAKAVLYGKAAPKNGLMNFEKVPVVKAEQISLWTRSVPRIRVNLSTIINHYNALKNDIDIDKMVCHSPEYAFACAKIPDVRREFYKLFAIESAQLIYETTSLEAFQAKFLNPVVDNYTGLQFDHDASFRARANFGAYGKDFLTVDSLRGNYNTIMKWIGPLIFAYLFDCQVALGHSTLNHWGKLLQIIGASLVAHDILKPVPEFEFHPGESSMLGLSELIRGYIERIDNKNPNAKLAKEHLIKCKKIVDLAISLKTSHPIKKNLIISDVYLEEDDATYRHTNFITQEGLVERMLEYAKKDEDLGLLYKFFPSSDHEGKYTLGYHQHLGELAGRTIISFPYSRTHNGEHIIAVLPKSFELDDEHYTLLDLMNATPITLTPVLAMNVGVEWIRIMKKSNALRNLALCVGLAAMPFRHFMNTFSLVLAPVQVGLRPELSEILAAEQANYSTTTAKMADLKVLNNVAAATKEQRELERREKRAQKAMGQVPKKLDLLKKHQKKLVGQAMYDDPRYQNILANELQAKQEAVEASKKAEQAKEQLRTKLDAVGTFETVKTTATPVAVPSAYQRKHYNKSVKK